MFDLHTFISIDFQIFKAARTSLPLIRLHIYIDGRKINDSTKLPCGKLPNKCPFINKASHQNLINRKILLLIIITAYKHRYPKILILRKHTQTLIQVNK